MRIDGRHYRSIWLAEDGWSVEIIDQTKLPHVVEIARLKTLADATHAIRAMLVRGAPLIGATAAYGLALALRERADDATMAEARAALMATRPTAVNLRWALERMARALAPLSESERPHTAHRLADEIADEDVATNRQIGVHGLKLIRKIAADKAARGGEGPVRILTHCNAGWLACVDWGTATAPIYMAHDAGLAVHVWVSETRPRNQGAAITAFELGQHGVPHTLVVDNAAGHLMQQGLVDMVLVGSDRTTAAGDVCNKIGTYLKALAARDNGVPFYVALPSSTIDQEIEAGRDVPIEERDGDEVLCVTGRGSDGALGRVAIAPRGTKARNPAFDVTPARLVSGLITERGVIGANAREIGGVADASGKPDARRGAARAKSCAK